MFDVTERVRTGLNLLYSDNVNSNYVTPTARRECLLAMSAAWLSPELAEKLIELVRKCEQWYDISNKKFSDRVWKEKLWGQIGDELKKSGKFRCSFIAHIEVTIILSWEMSGACDAYRGGERCAQGSGGETWGKETIGETQM